MSAAGRQAAAHAVQIGLDHHRRGDTAAAAAAYEYSLTLDPDNPDALHLAGVAMHQHGDHRGALARIHRAVEIAPRAAFYNSLGEAHRALGELEEALDAYAEAIALAPGNAAAHHNAGLALVAKEAYVEAHGRFTRALSLAPGDPDTLNRLGETARRLGRDEEAAGCFRRVLETAPGFTQAPANLADLLTDQGRSSDALQLVRGVSGAHCAGVQHALARALLAENRIAEALRAGLQALALEPCFAEAYVTLGLCHARNGDRRRAVAAFDTALVIEPRHNRATAERRRLEKRR